MECFYQYCLILTIKHCVNYYYYFMTISQNFINGHYIIVVAAAASKIMDLFSKDFIFLMSQLCIVYFMVDF